ncbi:MAG: septum formation initiator family protein [Acidimicrobiia bacterium]
MRRHPWFVASLLALFGVLVLGSFPARAYLDQLDQREDLTHRVAALEAANAELAATAAHLGTDEAVERLARERYQLVKPGEEAYAILPTGEPEDEPSAAPPAPGRTAPAAALEEPGFWSRVWGRVTSIL